MKFKIAATSLVASVILFGCATADRKPLESNNPEEFFAKYNEPFFVSIFDYSNKHSKDIRRYCLDAGGKYEYFHASTVGNRPPAYHTCEMGDDSWAAVSNAKPKIRGDQVQGFIYTIKATDPLIAASEIERLRPIVSKEKAEQRKRWEEERREKEKERIARNAKTEAMMKEKNAALLGRDSIGKKVCMRGNMVADVVARSYTREFRNVANTTAILIAHIEGHSGDNRSLQLRAAGWRESLETKLPLIGAKVVSYPIFEGSMPSQPGSVFWDRIGRWDPC